MNGGNDLPVEPATGRRAAGAEDHDPALVDLLDRVIDRGAVISGDVVLSVAGVDLVHLGLRLVLTGIDQPSART
ncbi:MAG: gas vesicle protein [Actinomycetota bacterium]|nr:gas vesicle protein [Actinomycetota bacterium]